MKRQKRLTRFCEAQPGTTRRSKWKLSATRTIRDPNNEIHVFRATGQPKFWLRSSRWVCRHRWYRHAELVHQRTYVPSPRDQRPLFIEASLSESYPAEHDTTSPDRSPEKDLHAWVICSWENQSRAAFR